MKIKDKKNSKYFFKEVKLSFKYKEHIGLVKIFYSLNLLILFKLKNMLFKKKKSFGDVHI